jgi:hypothetical protein
VTEDWLTSRPLAAFLASCRDNDIKVNIRGTLVPLADVHYNHSADTIVIDLVDGEDLRMALETD